MSRETATAGTREPEFWVKLHPAGRDIILAVCDMELIEKSFEEGELRITVYRQFYGGAAVSEEGLEEHMRRATTMNLVGERCVRKAVELGWVDSENIIRIQGIPHAQAAILFDDIRKY